MRCFSKPSRSCEKVVLCASLFVFSYSFASAKTFDKKDSRRSVGVSSKANVKKSTSLVRPRKKAMEVPQKAEKLAPLCPWSALPRLYEAFSPRCVRVCFQKEGKKQVVSGFFVSEQGHVLTSLQGGSDFVIETNEHQPFSAKKCGEDAVSCLCLLKADLKKNQTVPCFSLCHTTDWPVIGQPLVSFSCKLGQSISPQIGFATNYSERYFEKQFPFTLVRSTLRMDAGDMGGAVIDLQGNLQGMLLHALPDTSETFYMPTGALDRVFQDLLLLGHVRYSYAGLSTESVFDTKRKVLCLKIQEVASGSPAEKVGFCKGDILVERNGAPIDSIESFKNFIFLSKPGDSIVCTVLRGEKTMQILLPLAEKK